MTKQLDGAFLFWARDWLTDEAVVLMSPAAKGIYIDLLCHCWLEGSIPACSMQCARIARLDPEAFDVLWRELAPLFVAHASAPDRLVNKRMEEERSKQEDRRKARSDKAKAAAEARWKDKPKQSKRNARGNARSNANAPSQALLGDAHQTKPSTTPLTPQGEGPTSGGVDARPPVAGEPEPSQSEKSQQDAVVQLQDALRLTAYRSNIPDFKRRIELGKRAAQLAKTGLTPEHVAELGKLDRAKADQPGALLATWLDKNSWRMVLDEQRSKSKETKLRSVNPPDDVLDGIYGDTQPKTAASVIDGLLPKKAGRA